MRIITQDVYYLLLLFASFCLVFLDHINHKLLSLFGGCEVSSEEVFKKITITERTKTYEALILRSDLFSGQV